jgi:soluble lytic murein transglycosylase-like protein
MGKTLDNRAEDVVSTHGKGHRADLRFNNVARHDRPIRIVPIFHLWRSMMRSWISLIPLLVMTLVGFNDAAQAEIYVRTYKDGHKEFTNRPSGPGWVFYASESGQVPEIRFEKQGRPKSLDEIVEEIAENYQISPHLVKAIIVAESNCNAAAVSSKGAQGLMQLMPATAKKLKVNQPLDPRENIIGGVSYIKGLLASYGDLRLALAAYNAGPGAVEKYAGIPPYRETINYVKKVIHHFKKFKEDPSLRVAGSGPGVDTK